MQRLIIILFILLIPAACSHKSVVNNKLELASDIDMQLLSPGSFGQNLSLTQSIEFQYDGKMRELLIQSEISNEKMVVVGLTTNGTRLFTVNFDGNLLKSEEISEIENKLQLQYMLADIQLSLWPLAVIQRHLQTTSDCFKKDHCKFVESANKLKRTLIANGKSILIINYESIPYYKSRIEFINKHRDYQLIINPIAAGGL